MYKIVLYLPIYLLKLHKRKSIKFPRFSKYLPVISRHFNFIRRQEKLYVLLFDFIEYFQHNYNGLNPLDLPQGQTYIIGMPANWANNFWLYGSCFIV